ncbi:MAG: transketolase [Armatimonadota bacterium]
MGDLARMATRIRRHVVRLSHSGRAPHVGSALSCVDILVALYFRVAQLDPARPRDPGRDRVILSKGHAAAALYACLAERGFLPVERLAEFAAEGSALAEHPSYPTLPGIECTTGSLGHGLGIGAGMATGMRLAGRPGRVFVVVSDGECNEGSTWEAALWAPAQKLTNLCCIVDANGLQATGRTAQITRIEPLVGKWREFGWNALEVDGHDLDALVLALSSPDEERPTAIVARTTKGKGVSFMEDDIEWHYRPPSQEDLLRALAELAEDMP